MVDTGSQSIINSLKSAPPKPSKIFVATLVPGVGVAVFTLVVVIVTDTQLQGNVRPETSILYRFHLKYLIQSLNVEGGCLFFERVKPQGGYIEELTRFPQCLNAKVCINDFYIEYLCFR